MGKPVALITGAGGEMGRLLAPGLVARGCDVVAMDLNPLPASVADSCVASAQGDLMDEELMRDWLRRYRPRAVFHLAALLSAKAEQEPDLAHRINVQGTLQLFRLCRENVADDESPIRFLFPSSIAVYGLPDAATKTAEGAVSETQWTVPVGVYDCNKLYCELIGSYLSRRHGGKRPALDFRSIRFPGLISADSLPSGGTTDYAPEMVHAAARGESYRCFVSPSSRLPFMTMPDAVESLMRLAWAEPEKLSTRVYNINGFSATAEELRTEILREFPQADLGYAPNEAKQALVDSWPADLIDRRARDDWGLDPAHDLRAAIADYLTPALKRRYAKS